jgi:hypothetical protein
MRDPLALSSLSRNPDFSCQNFKNFMISKFSKFFKNFSFHKISKFKKKIQKFKINKKKKFKVQNFKIFTTEKH